MQNNTQLNVTPLILLHKLIIAKLVIKLVIIDNW